MLTKDQFMFGCSEFFTKGELANPDDKYAWCWLGKNRQSLAAVQLKTEYLSVLNQSWVPRMLRVRVSYYSGTPSFGSNKGFPGFCSKVSPGGRLWQTQGGYTWESPSAILCYKPGTVIKDPGLLIHEKTLPSLWVGFADPILNPERLKVALSLIPMH